MLDNLITLDSYRKLIKNLSKCKESERIDITRYLCRTDLFFLLWFGCGRVDMAHEWLLARCKEVQAEPDNCLDLWARGHYKSTIITFGKTIQDVLGSHGDSPLPKFGGKELTFGIFSCTRPIAKAFLAQIKREFETNDLLKKVFPDIIWEQPTKDAAKWSEDTGLILRRKSNPKEATIEAWGVVEGQPTSKHFDMLIFDDLVTVDNVRSPLMIKKTNESLGLADNLGSKSYKQRFIGTRYHFNDTYRDLIKSGTVKVRKYPATVDGEVNGEPVLLSKEALAEKRKRQGAYVFACQMLLNPVADETQGFKKEWLRFHDGSDGSGLNIYIIVDPANEKKKTSDFTAITVIGLGADENYYLLDMIRDRLNLKERIDELMRLHRKWRPNGVGYEKYGMQADVSYLREKQNKENYHFDVTELSGKVAKFDRIRELIPSFSNNRWYFPHSIFRNNYEGKTEELIDIFVNEELLSFPVCVHDDLLDCLARILDPDLNAIWPRIFEDERARDRYSNKHGRRRGSAWAA